MKSKNSLKSSAAAPPVEDRYLHIAGAFAAGGTVARFGPRHDIEIPIPTVAPVELPMVGGLSIAKASKTAVDCSKIKFGAIPKDVLAEFRRIELFAIGSATATCRSRAEVPGKPYQSSVTLELSGVRADGGFGLKTALLNLQSEHPAGQRFPNITIGPANITGMKLGKLDVAIELDLDSFNRFPTLELLEPAILRRDKKISARVAGSFQRRPDGTLHRNAAGYTVGSLVKSIAGVPKEWIEEDGYTINWPGFGKVIVGQILIGAYVRRVTLVRLKQAFVETDEDTMMLRAGGGRHNRDKQEDIEIGGGCDGGSSWP